MQRGVAVYDLQVLPLTFMTIQR